MSTEPNPMNAALSRLVEAIDDSNRAEIAQRLDKVLAIYHNREWSLNLVVTNGLAPSPEEAVRTAKLFEAYLDGRS